MENQVLFIENIDRKQRWHLNILKVEKIIIKHFGKKKELGLFRNFLKEQKVLMKDNKNKIIYKK